MDLKGYFDYNATTPLCAEAKQAWLDAVGMHWQNPSSPYRAAAKVHVRLEAAREAVAALFEVEPERVIFNSGATEANNSVFSYWAATLPKAAKVGVSPTEHPSVIEAAKHYFKGRIVWLALDVAGAVDLERLVSQIEQGEVAAVSVMAANNETGILNRWEAVAEACRAVGCHFHCDASQWIGKLSLDRLSLCDFIVGCAHKFGGPRGVGFLVLSESAVGFSSLKGGSQQFGHRAGTEDVAGVLAMVAALQLSVEQAASVCVDGRDRFVSDLKQAIIGVQVLGEEVPRLPNTISVVMPEFSSERWIRALEKRSFWVSSGSACSSGKQGASHVLAAMGVDALEMRRVLRLSARIGASRSDWYELLTAFEQSYAALRSEAEGAGATIVSI